MGATSSTSREGGVAGKIVTVDVGRSSGAVEADPLLAELEALVSVRRGRQLERGAQAHASQPNPRPPQEPPFLDAGDVAFSEQLAAERSVANGPPGAAAAAAAEQGVRALARERAEALLATQDALTARLDTVEALAAATLRRCERGGAVGRVLAADMRHARPLQQELATLGAQLCGVLESYSALLATLEAAAGRRGSLPPGSPLGRPRQGQSSPLPPLRLTPAVPTVPPPADPPAPRHREGAVAEAALGSPGQSPRVSRAELPASPESLGREARTTRRPTPSPPLLHLAAAHAAAEATPGAHLPPIRVAATPPGPALSVPGQPPTPQSKRALFGAVAAAAAAAGESPVGGSPLRRRTTMAWPDEAGGRALVGSPRRVRQSAPSRLVEGEVAAAAGLVAREGLPLPGSPARRGGQSGVGGAG